jgi:hypothetical protein|tara:strand:- start:1046 stop:1360 length:315 start_codon:yes stop_codon:yes gene_type:complete
LILIYEYFSMTIMTYSGNGSPPMFSGNYSTLKVKAVSVGIKRRLFKNINVLGTFVESKCSIVWDIREDEVTRTRDIYRTFHPSSTSPQTFEMRVVDYEAVEPGV